MATLNAVHDSMLDLHWQFDSDDVGTYDSPLGKGLQLYAKSIGSGRIKRASVTSK